MNLSKRSFIKSVPFFATVPISTESSINKSKDVICGTGKPFIFKNEPNRIRKSFYDLNEEELKTIFKAVGYMRNDIKLGDPTQWDSYAFIHANHCTQANESIPQVHWSWFFLPWHRGYIFFLERILSNILTTKLGIDGSKFAYPYWDWINHKEMPNTKFRKNKGLSSPLFGYDLTQQDMVSIDNLGFDNLALYDGNRFPTISKPEMDPNNETTYESKEHIKECIAYMSSQYVDLMLSVPFEQFGGKSTISRQTGQGLLESGAHNYGHDWVGTRYGKNRNMGTLRSAAQDPIFFMHHANIDRIFSLYKQPLPDLNGPWGKQTYTYTDVDGSSVVVSVKDIMTKMNNVSYQAPLEEKFKLKKPNTSVNSISKYTLYEGDDLNLNNKISKKISLTESLVNFIKSNQEKTALLEIQTGPFNFGGKLSISVTCNNSYVGTIRVLDGRHDTQNSNMINNFTLMFGFSGDKVNSILNSNNSVEFSFETKIKNSLNLKIKKIELQFVNQP